MPFAALLAAAALTGATPQASNAENLVVAELFTSQSCSSCPPAEAYFERLSARPGVLALEWHVDYWDRLGTANGAWKDPFSSTANTARQRAYNVRLRGAANVYTPQAIVHGAAETVGSDASAVDRLIAHARTPRGPRVEITRDGGALRAAFAGAGDAPELLLVRFRTAATTRVAAGENHGKTLSSANIVTHTERLAPGALFAPPVPGEGCAVLAQEPGAGAIRAAARCEI